METTVYVLRHAQPASGDMPNRSRPLTDLGRAQAEGLVSYLTALQLSAVYTSPFVRAVQTIQPFCQASGISASEREDLRESGADELLPQVRERMVGAVQSIIDAHSGDQVLVCTHGGNLWGLISHFDSAFDYEDYRQIRSPDLKRFLYTTRDSRLDGEFSFDLASMME
jgi:2,3-bisphosphoglycerate-dependent phosphoglycerate mutase